MAEVVSVSVIVPVYNDSVNLRACLDALSASDARNWECIVVDDGSTDDSEAVARAGGARVLQTGARRGPAHARNLGALHSSADVLLFIDADVCVHADTISRVQRAFAADQDLSAVIGSYDDRPASQSFLSQYKNLQHAFVHQTSREQACTFWSGCGAIRRNVFLAHGGFDERYERPAIEDIELGYRLRRAGHKLALDRDIQVKHLKRWTLPTLVRSDVLDRGIPWTELILRDRDMPADLNLRHSQRVSVALAWLLAPAALLLPIWCALLLLALLIVLNRDFYSFLARKRGVLFAVAAVPVHILYFLYSGFAFGAGAARYALRLTLAAALLAGSASSDDGWSEFRSGPFHILARDADKNARAVLNELEQIRHVLGNILGKQELKSVWPIRVVVAKDRRAIVYPEPKLARDAYVASLLTVQPETRTRVVQLLIDSNAGPLPVQFENGLVTLFSTFEAQGTRLTLGASPPRKDRDWSRMNMLTSDPRFTGKLRVLLANLQNGADLDPAYKNAFEMTSEQIERELDRYLEAGQYGTASPSALAIDPERRFIARTADPKLVELTQLDLLVLNGKAGAQEYAKHPGAENTPVPLLKAGQLEAAAKANPLWAEPWWLEAQKEQSAVRRVQLLAKATQLAPRKVEYWLALARAQEQAEQFADAVKSWTMAERAAPTRSDKEQIRQSRLAGEEMRLERLRLEREEERRKAQAEVEALRQRALADIRAAEARANAGKPPIDISKLDEYRENMGHEKLGGRLDRIDCLGRSARLTVTTAGGSAIKLLVVDPTRVAIVGGGERALPCGPQKPARTVTIDYVVKANSKLGTAGEVSTIEFR